MNKGMRASIGLLLRLPLYILFFWLIFEKILGSKFPVMLLAAIFAVLGITIFLSSWFGLLLKNNPTFISILKYYMLSAILGGLLINAFILILMISTKGIHAVPSEYRQLVNDLSGDIQSLIILISIFVAIPIVFTTYAVFERPEPPSDRKPWGM